MAKNGKRKGRPPQKVGPLPGEPVDRAVILGLLEGLPAGVALLEEVEAYFGRSFCIVRSRGEGSSYNLLADTRDGTFDGVAIALNPDSSRAVASLIHQLLRVRLYANGLPRVAILHSEARHLHEQFISTISAMTNVIQQEMIVRDFVETGLPLSEFLGPSAAAHDYDLIAKQHQADRDDPGIGSWWAQEYFRHKISIGHYEGDRSEQQRRLAEHIAQVGDGLIPDFAARQRTIDAWLENREFADLTQYAKALNVLLPAFSVPPPMAYSHLEKKDGKVAGRLTYP